jgi:hypothetical protein
VTVAVSTVSTLFDLAVDLLAAADEALATTEEGAPAMTYISPGVPTYDYTCDTLAVYVPSLTEESTSPLNPPPSSGWRHRRGRINLAGLTVVSARCGVVTTTPTALQITAAAKKNYEDGWAIWNVVTQKIKDGTLFGGGCSDVHFDGGLSLTPQAGLVLWQMTLRVEIGGYPA